MSGWRKRSLLLVLLSGWLLVSCGGTPAVPALVDMPEPPTYAEALTLPNPGGYAPAAWLLREVADQPGMMVLMVDKYCYAAAYQGAAGWHAERAAATVCTTVAGARQWWAQQPATVRAAQPAAGVSYEAAIICETPPTLFVQFADLCVLGTRCTANGQWLFEESSSNMCTESPACEEAVRIWVQVVCPQVGQDAH